jgi:hypothetical protein
MLHPLSSYYKINFYFKLSQNALKFKAILPAILFEVFHF